MQCEEYAGQASLFIDGKLEAAEQALLFAHLSTCAECREFLESSVRIRQIARSEHVVVPASADEALFEAIAHRTGSGQRVHLIRRIGGMLKEHRFAVPIPVFATLLALAIGLGAALSALFMRPGETAGPMGVTVNGHRIAERQPSVVIIYALPEERVIGTLPASGHQTTTREVY